MTGSDYTCPLAVGIGHLSFPHMQRLSPSASHVGELCRFPTQGLPLACRYQSMTANPDPLAVVLHRDFFSACDTTAEAPLVPRCRDCGRVADHADCTGHLPGTTLAAVVLAWSLGTVKTM